MNFKAWEIYSHMWFIPILFFYKQRKRRPKHLKKSGTCLEGKSKKKTNILTYDAECIAQHGLSLKCIRNRHKQKIDLERAMKM